MPLQKNPLFKNVRWKRLVRLFHYFRPDIYRVRGELILALMCTLGAILAALARPWPIKIVFDYALIPKHHLRWALPFDLAKGYGAMGVASVSCVLLLVIALVGGLFAYYQSYLIAAAGQRLTFAVRRRYFAHLQRLSLSVHNSHRAGDLVLRATGDTNMLREMLVDSVLIILSEVLVVFGMLGVMFVMDWQLTAASLAVLPLMTLTAFRFSHQLREAVRLQRQRDGRMAALLSEVLHAIIVVQAFGRQAHEDARFGDFNKRSLKQGMRAVRLEAGLERVVEVLVSIGTAGVIWFGVRRVLQGYLTPGDLLVFIGYLGSTYKPLRRIARLTTRLSKATVSGERVAQILAIQERVKERKNARPAPPFRGAIEFDDLQILLCVLQSGRDSSLLIQHEGIAIENQFILAADQVDETRDSLRGRQSAIHRAAPGNSIEDLCSAIAVRLSSFYHCFSRWRSCRRGLAPGPGLARCMLRRFMARPPRGSIPWRAGPRSPRPISRSCNFSECRPARAWRRWPTRTPSRSAMG